MYQTLAKGVNNIERRQLVVKCIPTWGTGCPPAGNSTQAIETLPESLEAAKLSPCPQPEEDVDMQSTSC